jgi:aspartate/methionine/tyrosine aminotransferase
MALRSISKELPWPGSRCGWIEVFNRKNDPLFERYIKTLLDAKMLEVCSTTLPQMAIPEIYASPKFIPHLSFVTFLFNLISDKINNILSLTIYLLLIQHIV